MKSDWINHYHILFNKLYLNLEVGFKELSGLNGLLKFV